MPDFTHKSATPPSTSTPTTSNSQASSSHQSSDSHRLQRAVGNQASQRFSPGSDKHTANIRRQEHETVAGGDDNTSRQLASATLLPRSDQHKHRRIKQVDETNTLPAEVSGPGTQLDQSVASKFAHRFNFDLASVRIHTDSAAARDAESLGARAFTWGRHIVFGKNAYQPQTKPGQALLAHEFTHVAQQLSGNTQTETEQERQADAVEAGASLNASKRGHPRPVLRLRGDRAVSLTIVADSSGAASFSIVMDTGGSATAGGSVTGLAPGDYTVSSTGAAMVIRQAGSIVPRTSRFDIPWNEQNATLVRALGNTTAEIPMHVQSGTVPGAGSGNGTGTGNGTGGGSGELPLHALQRQQLQDLPERIRNFLFTEGSDGTADPEDYATLLRIAQSIADLSDYELAEYRARTTSGTSSVAEFEESVNRWLAQLSHRRTSERNLDEATQDLFGLDAIYEMYRSWQLGMLMGAPPSWIAEWEAMPTSALPATREGTLNQLYLRMRRSLQAYGYNNLAAFTTAIQSFLTAFRENAYYMGLDLLDRYEHILVEENNRYSANSASLFSSLAPARQTFQQADEYAAAARAQHGGMSPDDIHAYYAAGAEYRRQIAEGRSQVAAQAGQQPLLRNQDFPLEQLGRAQSESGVSSIIGSYISEGLGHVRDTRSRLNANHEVIFSLDILVTQTKARQGIGPDSIWSKIIEDHQAPTVEEVALEAMLGVLAVAAGIMSGGSLLAAGVSLGLSSYFALQQYEDYAFREDAYGAQLLAEEPSLAWVVLAIIGVVADFAVVSRVLRPIRTALQEFQAGGDIATLESRLGGVEERIRRSIMARAELEVQARQGWQGIVPPGSMRASLFGLDLIADGVGRVAYSIYINLRRGINTFNRWVLTREAIDLIGDINNLTPAQLQQVRALYRQAITDTRQIVTHGRSLNMTDAQIEAAMQAWAQRGSGSVADVIAEMTEQSRVGTYSTQIRWGILDVDARPHSSIEGAFWGRRSTQPNPRVDAYELKVSPNNESFFLPHPAGGYVQYENLAGGILQDGKLIMAQRSIYHIDDMPPFARARVLEEARRQVAAAQAAGLSVEWLVSEARAIQQLRALFTAENIAITIRFLPE